MPVQPRPEQFQDLVAAAGDGPLYMLNLLRFKPRAVYADGRETDLTGQQAYALYGDGVSKLIAGLGGRIVFSGPCRALVIGDGALAWDAAGIVEYPSLQAFQAMVASAAYQEIHVHREAGLDHQLLIYCESLTGALGLVGE